MTYSISYDKLMQYALRILSKKRYTISEMQKKLTLYANRREKVNEEDVNSVLNRLLELNYLDDEKFAKDYVSQRIHLKPRGKSLLKRELKFKGIPNDILDKIFEEIDFNEEQFIFEALSKRSHKWDKFPLRKQKLKAYQFLYSRGFKREAIYKALEAHYN